MTSSPPRPLPELTETNRYFWSGGADGRLRILRCHACSTWIHPYTARCPDCHSDQVAPQPVSGRGKVVGYTVNHQPWVPTIPVPYVVALVELIEQNSVRLMTNLPRVPIAEVFVGMDVEVYFEQHGEIYLPLFDAARSGGEPT